MWPLLTSAEMREAEKKTAQLFKVPELLMMEHAAIAAKRSLEQRFGTLLPETRGYLLIGPGNNGADALALARLLAASGTTRLLLGFVGTRNRAGVQQEQMLERFGLKSVDPTDAASISGCDWYADGLFGIGLTRDLVEIPLRAVEAFNLASRDAWSLAIDIPSGLCANTGRIRGGAVRAKSTVTMGFAKRGLFTGQAAEYAGMIELAPVQIPPESLPSNVDVFLFGEEDARKALPVRSPSSHKGTHGHVGIFAGAEDKQGACLITALAALRTGAGLVSLIGEGLDGLRTRSAIEIMTAPSGSPLDRFSAIVIGPGLSRIRAEENLRKAIGAPCALILDADALNIIAENPERWTQLIAARKASTVMTPHPKEASRLLGCTVADIEADRFNAVRTLAQKFKSLIVLKGHGTLVGPVSGPVLVTERGDATLAKAGAGDLLCGVLAALLGSDTSQLSMRTALACFVHGLAAEWTTQRFGQTRSALVSEVAESIPPALAQLEAVSK